MGETDRDLPPWGSWSAGGGRQLANNEYVYVSTSKLCGYVRGCMKLHGCKEVDSLLRGWALKNTCLGLNPGPASPGVALLALRSLSRKFRS